MQAEKTRDWHDMTHDELLIEVRLWRARAMQNRAELKHAQMETENWQLKHQIEHRNLMGLKLKLKDTQQRVTELEGTTV